jgi:hypothetical protein
MTTFMTIDQILSAAKSDINNKIQRDLFRGNEPCEDDNDENFETITSLYSQWAEDKEDAETELFAMYNECYPEWF